MANVELSVDANLQGLRQQLQSIPGLTAEQARLMTAELNKSIKASEKAAKSAADASKRAMEQTTASAKQAGAAVAQTGEAFGKAGSNSAKLAGALSMVSPAFGDAARNVADFADVGEVAAGVLGKIGPIGAGVAVGIGVLAVALPAVSEALSDQTVESEALMRQYALLEAATYSAAQAQRTYDAALAKARTEADLILGLKSKERAATEASIQAFRDQTQEQINAQQAAIAQAEITKGRIQDEIDAGATVSDRIELERRLSYRIQEAEQIQKKAREEQTKSKAELEKYIDVKEAELVVNEKAASDALTRSKADARATQASKSKASADKAAADAARLLAEAEREVQSARASAQAVIDTEVSAAGRILDKQADLRAELEAHPELYGEVTAAIAVLDRQLQALDDQEVDAYLKRQADAAKELQSAYENLIPPEVPTRQEQFATLTAQVEQAFRDGIITFDDYQSKLAEIQTAQEETFSLEQFAAFFEGIKSSTSQVFSDLEALSSYFLAQNESALSEAIKARKDLGDEATKDEKDEAKKRVQAARDAAMRQFEITKALQIAQVVVNTAAAAAQALASSPPPFNFVAAAAAAAAGAVQLATVASTQPKFHKGGLIGQPDESMAVVRAGEAVLNPMGRKALGDDAIRAANAGALDHGGGAVQVVYKHKSFDYFVRDHLRTNATLPRALNAGRRLGHRGG
jgi:hypothetical protein